MPGHPLSAPHPAPRSLLPPGARGELRAGAAAHHTTGTQWPTSPPQHKSRAARTNRGEAIRCYYVTVSWALTVLAVAGIHSVVDHPILVQLVVSNLHLHFKRRTPEAKPSHRGRVGLRGNGDYGRRGDGRGTQEIHRGRAEDGSGPRLGRESTLTTLLGRTDGP